MSSPTTIVISSSLVNSCLSHLSIVPNPVANSKEVGYRSCLNDEFGRFKLWAHGFIDLPGHESGSWKATNNPLDEVLERSEYLKEPTITLLARFASCLLTDHIKQVGDETTHASVESEIRKIVKIYPHIEGDICDLGREKNHQSILKELHNILDSLFELASPLNDVLESLYALADLNPYSITESYKNFIYDKFPNANQYLVLRFAKGNAERHEWLRAQAGEGSAAGIGPSVSSQTENNPKILAPSVTASCEQPASFHDSGIGSSHPTDPTIIVNHIQNTSPEEPAVDTSHSSALFLAPPPSVSGLSESTFCSLASELGNRPSIPSMPQDYRSKAGFKCSVCHRLQKPILNKRQWRKHIFSDLQPYICIHEGCTEREKHFQSRGEWIAHQNSHKSFNHDSRLGIESCPFCLKEFASDQTRFYSHVGHHMEVIRLFTLPPSYRQSDDFEAFDNSSESESTEAIAGGQLPIIVEEDSPQPASANTFREKLKAYKTPDKDKFLGDWLSNRKVAEKRSDTVSETDLSLAVIETYDEISDIWQDVEGEEYFKVLRWVSDVEYSSHHAHIRRNRNPGSCNWILENENFDSWRQLDLRKVLWLHGAPGSGKTILASKVIDAFKVQLRMNHALAYFYCDFRESRTRDPGSILSAIVKQLCVVYSRKHLPKPLLSIYKDREKEGHLSPLELIESKDFITKLSKEFERTTIIIDALDECDGDTREDLLRVLREIAASRNSVRIFLTSRDVKDIRDMLYDIPVHYIDIEGKLDDIKTYIRHEVERFSEEKPWLKADEVLKNEIISTLERGAHGTFLWVDLQIQAIRDEFTIEGVRRALTNLPESLDQTYFNILQKIVIQSKTAHHRAKIVVLWILYTQGACSPQLVSQALLVESMAATLDKGELMGCSQMVAICQGLVVYDIKHEVLRFTHFSVQEFLRGQEEFCLAVAHTSIAEICLTVLTNYSTSTSPVPELLNYAVFNWAAHVRLSNGGRSDLKQLWRSFLQPSSPFYKVWAEEICKDRNFSDLDSEGTISPLWVACYYQLYDVFDFLLKDGFAPDCYNRSLETPLILAARRGYRDFSELLLRCERVDVNHTDKFGRSALLWAVREGHEEVVALLLEKDEVDVSCKDKDGRSALSLAIEYGYEKVEQFLREKGAVE